MNKLIVGLAILGFAECNSYAGGLELPDGTVIPMEFDEYGGPITSPGVQVMPNAQIPRAMATKEELLAEEKDRANLLKLGYRECIKDCKDIKYYWQDDIAAIHNVPIDAMKKHLSDIKLSFPYKGIPFVKESDVITNVINSTGPNDEANIITQIFNAPDNMGICGFEIADNRIYHTFLAEEDVNYDVNSKITENMHVFGNTTTGFIYNLPWYDDKYSYSLTCLDYKFNKDVKLKITNFAKKVDSALNAG